MIDVTTLGAVGDGVTDDSAAIRAALLVSDAIYFPAGTYLVSKDAANNYAIRVQFGKTLFGDGRKVSKIRLADGQDCHVFRVDDEAEDVEARHLCIDGNRAGQGGTYAFNGWMFGLNCREFSCTDMLFENCDRSGLYIGAGSTLGQIRTIRSRNHGYAGVHTGVVGDLACSRIIFDDIISSDTGNAGVAAAGDEMLTLGVIAFENGKGPVKGDGITTYYYPRGKQNVTIGAIVSDGGQHGGHSGGDHTLVGFVAVRDVEGRGWIHANTGDNSACKHVNLLAIDVDGTTGINQHGAELRDCEVGSIAHCDVSGATGQGVMATTGPAAKNDAVALESNAAIGNAISGIRALTLVNGVLATNRARDNGDLQIKVTGGGSNTIPGNNSSAPIFNNGTGNVLTGNIG